jgi:hypothetical protein
MRPVVRSTASSEYTPGAFACQIESAALEIGLQLLMSMIRIVSFNGTPACPPVMSRRIWL